MKRRESLALWVVLLVVLSIPTALFGYQALRNRTAPGGVRVIEIAARVPEQGGFIPDRIVLKAGETVRLRISSPDVLHGIVVPELGVNIGEILPGKPVEVEITPDKPGRYAFACIRWCSLDHWRMRGVIEVEGETQQPLPTEPPPLFQQLGIDLDAMHPTPEALPSKRPSASAGAKLGVTLPGELNSSASRRAIVPADAFEKLRSDPANKGLSDSDIWNLVAWAWLKDTTPQSLAHAQELYSRDCAACHGVDGKGNGVVGKNLPGMSKMDPMMPKGPADFTDAGQRLAESDAFLQGKILRGGMGTGMPEFGSLYTDDELWAMVAYVRSFLFDR